MWNCLVWDERSTPNNFGVPSHRFNSATGEQKGITQTIYTDSEPPSQCTEEMDTELFLLIFPENFHNKRSESASANRRSQRESRDGSEEVNAVMEAIHAENKGLERKDKQTDRGVHRDSRSAPGRSQVQ